MTHRSNLPTPFTVNSIITDDSSGHLQYCLTERLMNEWMHVHELMDVWVAVWIYKVLLQSITPTGWSSRVDVCVPEECYQVCRALLVCWVSALCCSTCMGSTGPEEGSGKAVVHWGHWAAWPSPQAQEGELLIEWTERQAHILITGCLYWYKFFMQET